MVYLLLIPMLLMSIGSGYCQKKYQSIAPEGAASFMIYAMVIGASCTVMYFIANGCHWDLRPGVMLFSVIYGLVVVFSTIVTIISLKHAGVVLTNVLTCWSILPTLVFDYLTGVRYRPIMFVAVAVGIAASLVAVVGVHDDAKVNAKGVIAGLCGGIINATATLLLRMFVEYFGTENILEYYGLTNVFVVFWTLVEMGVVACLAKKNGGDGNPMRKLKWSHVIFISLSGFFGVINALAVVPFLSKIDYIPYVIFSTCISRFSVLTVAVLFKEKITLRKIVALVLGCFSGVLAGIGQNNK